VLIVFRDASLFGNRGLKRIVRTIREHGHDSIAHVRGDLRSGYVDNREHSE
jgi:hypothetical protein